MTQSQQHSLHIAVASDHAGLSLKLSLVAHLRAAGHGISDFGTDSTESVDYPDHGAEAARAVASGKCDLGLLVCGTGIGMSMVANKIDGVRAALCHTEWEARATRAHNDANVLCLGERVVGPGLAEAILDAFLNTPFEGGRHERRVAKISALEKE
ncbi:MAG: ribose 5-phosphate isomerase B [Deltaproteobacteria bacterium]|nr:ribose 5-phosphate isomerase B [Deltaproteobacteria bacterium]